MSVIIEGNEGRLGGAVMVSRPPPAWCRYVDLVGRLSSPVVIYAIRCPRCSAKADGIMTPSGTKGSYREVYVDHRLARIVCPSCKLVQEVGPGGRGYELWYKTDFKGHTLWARNEEHAHALIEWLSSGRSGTGTPYEALPKWMITDRVKVVAKLRKLVDGG